MSTGIQSIQVFVNPSGLASFAGLFKKPVFSMEVPSWQK
jgi:hypothetical protein